MQELLDKFNRDRWVEILTELMADNQDVPEYRDTLEEIIDYLEGKETIDV